MRIVSYQSVPCRFLSFVAILLVVSACNQSSDEVVREVGPRPVKLVITGPAALQEARRFPAVVRAAQTSDLNFQIGGQIEELLVTESQRVSEGDIIARLNQQNISNEVAAARAQFENADEEYQRAVRLVAEDAIARNVVEQREAQRDVASAALDTAEKALEDSVLRAPFSGVIAALPVDQLVSVQQGQTIATLISASSLEASIDVPASIIAQTPTRTNTRASVFLDAAPNLRIDAVFSEATLVADATSQTYSATFAFDPPEGLLILPGMSATVEISTTVSDNEANRVAVPLAAISSDGSGQFVWVVDEETMIVSRRGIEIEPGIGEFVVVTDGLENGLTIVGAGASLIYDGMQVRAWNE